ncbi:bifunctional protein-serine/threonine kinase/phosphatase [Sphaerotilus uruguayifluvii]|uniref:Serine/threonine protein phosphatase PrpC n=1 Tax=Sphaerotilus uruguayifluvii TaxID=2735897 RepID=A0ABX2G8Z4_9BURK|nr:bifunctional protein-serine/threonine kinase/phosphatase [Leptothrix sp. C29]NRT58236.1 serine/threonine protein phosphatase PrpC [Leptothrix sp. C29]
MSFDVDIGHTSASGVREHNEDFAAAVRAGAQEPGRGLIAAVADGVSAGGLGREAAQTTVMSLVQDFHAAPATWETTVVLDRLIGAQNAWLADHNRRRGGPGGDRASGLTTLTALALQGHTWTVAHVGDTRAWLLRAGELQQLTQDHAIDHPDFRSQLTRAVGLDLAVRADYLQGELQTGDIFMLTTDGVHGVLRPEQIRGLLAATPAQIASEAIVKAALEAGSQDNVTALVMQVLGLEPVRLQDTLLQARQLPVPPRMRPGDVLDGWSITALVADTGVHRLYQARDPASRELVAIKTLHESRASDREEQAMLAHEAWLGLQVTDSGAPGFVRVRQVRAPSAFYTVFDWHSGHTLEQLLAEQARRFAIPEVVQGGLAVCRALGRLHRIGVIHRDIKPGNLHLGEDGQWRVLDLGVAVSGREPASTRTLHAGTPSYMNPEQWEGAEGRPADTGSDLFALGVTLYQWLTGRLPYGEIEPWQTARFRRDPVAPSRLRPEVPIWLDHVVMKAIARDPRQRFETAEEFALALERGASRPLNAPASTPLVRRDPAWAWKVTCVISLGFNLMLVIWLLFLPR